VRSVLLAGFFGLVTLVFCSTTRSEVKAVVPETASLIRGGTCYISTCTLQNMCTTVCNSNPCTKCTSSCTKTLPNMVSLATSATGDQITCIMCSDEPCCYYQSLVGTSCGG
jgi:hypothetical protein